MKPFRFKFFLLLAVMALAFSPFVDAAVIDPVTHFVENMSFHDMGLSAVSLAIVPLAVYVRENTTITPLLIEELTSKYGKIKLITVVVEPPSYNEQGELIDKGEFYEFAVRRPDISTVRMLMNYAKQGKTDEYLGAFIKNMVVGGDVDKLKSGESGGDGIVYLGFATKVDEFLKPYESFLTNA